MRNKKIKDILLRGTFFFWQYFLWVWTQSLMLVRQVLYYLSHSLSRFYVGYFLCFF
jgi:hypothetical protein